MVVSCPRTGTTALSMSSRSSGSCPSPSSLFFLHGFALQPTAQLGCKVKAEGDGLYVSYEVLCSDSFAQWQGQMHPCSVPTHAGRRMERGGGLVRVFGMFEVSFYPLPEPGCAQEVQSLWGNRLGGHYASTLGSV